MLGQRLLVLWTSRPACRNISLSRRGIVRANHANALGKPIMDRSHAVKNKKVSKTDWSDKWARPERPLDREKPAPRSNRTRTPFQGRSRQDPRKSEPEKSEHGKSESVPRDAQTSRPWKSNKDRKRRDQEVEALLREKGLQGGSSATRKRQPKKETDKAEQIIRDVYIPEMINVANLSRILGVRLDRILKTMGELDMGNTSHDRILNADESSLIAMQLDMNPIVDARQALDLFPRPPASDPSALLSRPPVVTIMGHVDHGKTTLLDTLRKTSVAAGEAGGITQHIGAFSVTLPSKKTITFLDTPGHAAFSAMRARGAQVTDIVVLVVAADDGVMPQTQEAIKHATEAGVPIVVAVNKCDKPGVDPSRVKQELARYNVHLEEIGGDVPCVEVSGLTGLNLDQLEETIATLSEVLELKAERDIGAEGVVIESQIEKGRGNVATLLVHRGTLKVGAVVVAGQTWCKVRSMTDHQGNLVTAALPGTPVKVIGWKDVPNAGDELLQAPDEGTAKTVVDNRVARVQRDQQLRDLEVINDKRRQQREQLGLERAAEQEYKKEMFLFHRGLSDATPVSLGKRLSAIQSNLQEEERDGGTQPDILELRAVVKGDVSGTVEAVVDSLGGLQNKQIRVNVVHRGVGNISESDVQLAAACDGQVIGFNVRADKRIQAEASRSGVRIRSYAVIYKLLEEVKDELSEMLPPIVTTQVVGEASVLQIFDIGVRGRETRPVAGCRVTNGAIQRNGRVRLVRNKETIWEGQLNALRQVKKEINEAKKGLECGMSFEGFDDFKAGDVIQCVETLETRQRL